MASNWYDSLQGQQAPMQEQQTTAAKLDALLGGVADFAGRFIPGSPNFMKKVEGVDELSEGAAIGIAPMISPQATGRNVQPYQHQGTIQGGPLSGANAATGSAGRIIEGSVVRGALPKGGSTLPTQSGGLGGLAGSGGGAGATVSQAAAGSAPARERVASMLGKPGNTLADLSRKVADRWAALGLITTGTVGLMNEGADSAQGSLLQDTGEGIDMTVQDKEVQRDFAQMAYEVATQPERFTTLHQIDWEQMPRIDYSSQIRMLEQYAPPEAKADPSIMERMLQIAPAVIAGALAMGPAGALLGLAGGGAFLRDKERAEEIQRQDRGQAYTGLWSGLDTAQQTQNQLDWLQQQQGMQEQDLTNAQFNQWQKGNQIMEDEVVRARQAHKLGMLSEAQQMAVVQNQLAAQGHLLNSLGGGAQQGAASVPTIQTDPKMAEHVVKHVVNSLPKEVEAVLAQQGVDLAMFMMMPPSVEKTMVMANVANALLSQPPGSPIAQAMESFGRQYQTAGQASSLQSLAGF